MTFRRRVGAFVVAAALSVVGFMAVPSQAATVLKLATLVPDGSVWDKALKRMGSEWKKATDGRVGLRIYPGGVAGDEPTVLRKMRIGQLDAATLTISGLADIDPAFDVLAIPLFYESYDELFYVMERLEPVLRERLEGKGFHLLHWGHAGWVHFFSTQPVRTIDDLRQLKIFVSAGDDKMVQWWKDRGYKPVPLATTDIMTGLQTGMIDVLPTTPLAALSLQWFRQTSNMHELGIAPLVGATILTKRAWNRLSEADRGAGLAAAKEIDAQLREEIPGQDHTAVEEMSKRGLKVHPSPDVEAWKEAARVFGRSMRGAMVPEEVYDRAVAEREAFRRERPAGDAPGE